MSVSSWALGALLGTLGVPPGGVERELADGPAASEPVQPPSSVAAAPVASPMPREDVASPTELPPSATHPLRVRWGITAPVIATSTLGFALMESLGSARAAPVVCSPPQDDVCPNLGRLEAIDRVALGHYDHGAAKAADALLGVTLAGALAIGLAESIAWARDERLRGAPQARRRAAARFGIGAAIWAEAIGVAMVSANVLKDAVGRPRPLAHLPPDTLIAEDLEPDGDFGRSFPSGHATMAFSAAVAGATLLTRLQCEPAPGRRCAPRTRRQRVALGLAWGLGLASASTVATLRVAAGKHYPTDVLMGAALGATSGLVVPLLHRDLRR